MKKNERMPKAEYFQMRYENAIENNLSSKAEYYKSRLVQMGEWSEVKVKTTGTGLQRHEMDFGKGGESFVFYSM